jgi:2-alkenal reductase
LGAFKNSVTVGVVSATGCSIDTGRDYQLEGLIQTDAAINQGNSGGPLVNLRGEVVGINTLIVRGGGSGGAIAEGLGFAIPSNTARAVVDQIIAKGYVARPFMGIDWGWITPDISARYDLPVKYGVFVTHVVPDGPADQAGILRGDILSAIDGKPFGPNNPFINALFEYTPGSVVTLDVIRGVDRLRIELTLDEHRAP